MHGDNGISWMTRISDTGRTFNLSCKQLKISFCPVVCLSLYFCYEKFSLKEHFELKVHFAL